MPSAFKGLKLGLVLGISAIGAFASPVLADKFSFDSAPSQPGYTHVSAADNYSKGLGYGFLNDRTDLVRGGATNIQPLLFAVDVPEGSYRVTLKFGEVQNASTNTVKAEARRLMIEDLRTLSGKFITRSLIVNVRRPELKKGGRVRLKKDELAGHMDWDDQLTLEFNGSHPAVAALEIEKVENVPVIYIAGDSTVCDQAKEPWTSWGQMLPRFFKSDIVIANHAESGESLKSFQGEKRAEKILETLKAGDYLFIQFGHNDQKSGGAHADAFTTYKEILKQWVTNAHARAATPVLISPMNRRTFDENGKIKNSLDDYPEAVRQVAAEERVDFIDLNAMSKTLFETLGPEGTLKAFVHFPANTFPDQNNELKDDTHFTSYGAYELARCVVEGIKKASPDLAKHLADDVKPFDPTKPDAFPLLTVPASPFLKLPAIETAKTNPEPSLAKQSRILGSGTNVQSDNTGN